MTMASVYHLIGWKPQPFVFQVSQENAMNLFANSLPNLFHPTYAMQDVVGELFCHGHGGCGYPAIGGRFSGTSIGASARPPPLMG